MPVLWNAEALSMVAAVSIDPYTRQMEIVELPSVTLSADMKASLLYSAAPEGCHEEDFQAVAQFLGFSRPDAVNAYYLWNKRRRAVLFTGDATPDMRHCFRIGRPGKPVKPTAYFGKCVLIYYEPPVVGIHRTIVYHDVPGAPAPLPPSPHCAPLLPSIEWLHGDSSQFSMAAGSAFKFENGYMINDVDCAPSVCAMCREQFRKLMHCSGCKKVSYCCKDCQKAHWPIHKRDCRT
ncbi:hypothetical protein WJX74_002865 [Apatococcus lobatus]|uniref:MYND-type domain-containing protein n=1 Tax=Apatococcus lobatus TaxID=904363 RepID=A0AAW1R0B4_9CHLO